MRILLPTLRHSGTHFVREALKLPWHRIDHWRGEDDCIVQTHFDLPLMHLAEECARAMPVMIPLRNPESLARTHMARYGHVDHLKEGLPVMREFIRRCNPIWLPIDSPNRDAWLALASERLGMTLRDDWPVVSASGSTWSGDVPDFGHKDFFEQFYG